MSNNTLQNSMPWIEKYRPKKILDMVQSQELMELFSNNINTGNMTHYIFTDRLVRENFSYFSRLVEKYSRNIFRKESLNLMPRMIGVLVL